MINKKFTNDFGEEPNIILLSDQQLTGNKITVSYKANVSLQAKLWDLKGKSVIPFFEKEVKLN